MPQTTFYINIDDESPLVTYSPSASWQDQESSSDETTAEKSSQKTFHVTKATNASAQLSFVGTGIYVYGSKKSDHKSYAIILDNGTMIEGFSGESSKAAYKSSLAVVRNLPLRLHNIKIINMGDEAKKANGTMDIDEFFVEFDIGHGKDKHPGVLLVDDNETSLLKYSNGWGLTSIGGPASRFINDTVHETTTHGSSVTWDFYGSGVQVIGAVGPNNAEYSVKVDGMNFTMDATAENFVASHMLFHLENLTSSHHTLTLTHNGEKGKALTVDYFMAFNSTNGTTAAAHSNDDNSDDSEHKGLKPGAIVVIVVIILLVLGLLLGGIFYLYRRRRAQAQMLSKSVSSNPSPYPGVYGSGEPRDLEAGVNRRNSQSSNMSAQTMVGKASESTKKFGEWLGFGKSSDNSAPAPGQNQDHVIEISAPLGAGNGNGNGGRLGPGSRYSKATSFDEAWDKRDRRQVQSVYEDVDLQTPNAPAHHYNHGRSLSSPNPVTPMAHRRRFDDDYRESTNSFDPRAPWDPRRAPADYEPSFDDRNRRGYDRDRDRGRDDEYSRDRYDSRPAQPYNRYR